MKEDIEKTKNSDAAEKERKINAYRQANQKSMKNQIVFVGSSLMEMFPIEELLKQRGDEANVYNRGVGGFTTSELLGVMNECIIDLQPSKIFINIGTNDLSNPDISQEEMIGNYDKILSRIESELPDAEVYLMAYYPINYEAAADSMKACLKIRTNEKINEANKAVQELARKYQVKYIDVNKNLKDEKGRLRADYTIEGMHINEAGYQAILDDVLQYVHEPKWK